jgi:hypothetical protein
MAEGSSQPGGGSPEYPLYLYHEAAENLYIIAVFFRHVITASQELGIDSNTRIWFPVSLSRNSASAAIVW